ncbi:putative nucleotidyltransferase, ribonuclease H [Tanacetum coccineum]
MSFMTGTLIDPFQIPYLKRKLTMDEMINNFINEGRREHDEMEAFIMEFRTTNELLLKERNNSLCELGFELNIPFTEALIILGRPFLVTARAMIDVFNKRITLRVGDEEVIFNVDQSIKKPLTDDDKCYGIDDLDQTIHLEALELMENNHIDSFQLNDLDIDESDSEGRGERSNFEKSIRPSANGIDEKKPELKDLPSHLKYVYLNGDRACPVIVSSKLTKKEKTSLLQVLEKHKGAIAWKISNIKGISPSFCTHKILLEENFKRVIQPQRRLNPKVQDVVKNEIVKLLDSKLIYPISDSPWVSPIHVVPKKGGITVVLNDNNEAVPSRTVTGWRVCIDYRKLNDTTRKDHFPLPFIDQMLERLSQNEFYCFLDDFSGFFQIPIVPEDQEKTIFTCLYRTFAYRRMPFGLCNAPATFQRCMTAIFHDMVEDFMEVFMDDFSVFGNSFNHCLGNLDKMLARCEETNLVLNWEKCHFMVNEGIVPGHKISGKGIEVDRAKIDVIAKLPYPTNVKGVRSFLGHAGFYHRFIKDFSMISKPMTQLLMKDAKFDFSDNCKKALVISLAWETILEIEHAFEDKQYQPEGILELFRKLHNDVQNIHEELAEYINTSSWNHPIVYYDDDDEDYTIAITPVLSTEEPNNSLSMGDEHLETIPEIESDEVIKSSVEDLVSIPSESEGIPDKMCDVPFHDNSLPLDISKDQFEDFSDSNDDSTSIDDDSFSIDDIEYVEASPPDYELVSLEVVEIVIPKVGGIDTDILLAIKDDVLCEKLLNVNLLIAKIEALKDNPTPSSDFVTKSSSTSLNFFTEETNTFDNSLPESETFCFDLEENSSGSTTTRSDISLSKYDSFIFDLSNDPFPPTDRSDFYHEKFADELAHIISPPEYNCFYFKNEPELGDFTMDVVEDIFDNPTRELRVHVPNVLPTHPTLHLDLDFTLSSDSLGSDLVVSFPSETRNKIFDPGIFIGVQSMRFLSLDEFSISFIHDLPFPVIDTFLPFSPQNEDKDVNPGILASNEEKSPHLLSHRGFNPSKIISDFSESPMTISRGDIPILDVPFLHFYPP